MKNQFLFLLLLLSLAACKQTTRVISNYTPAPIQSQATAEQRLSASKNHIEKEIIKLTDKVYTAVGYDVSNITMVVGKDSIILIDAGMIPRLVQPLLADFKKIADKPLAALIFTHSHGDHTGGAKVFVGDQNPAIWGRDIHGNETHAAKSVGYVNKFRPVRQAGFLLEPEMRISNGIAIAVYPTPDGGPVGKLPPKLEAEKMAQLAGGKDQLLANAQQALSNGDFQWAAELGDHLMALNPNDATATLLKADALHELGLRQHNALARNYYLSRALQLRRQVNNK